MLLLTYILNQRDIKGCFVSRYENVAYEFINSTIELGSNTFFVKKQVGRYTNLIINFDRYKELILFVHKVIEDSKPMMQDFKILVDHFGVNMGKLVHYGHVRSLICGHIIKKICRFYYLPCQSDIHFGDGQIHIHNYAFLMMKKQLSIADVEKLTLLQLHEFYIEIHRDKVKGVCEEKKYYQSVYQVVLRNTREHIDAILEKLNINFDFMFGESRYYDFCSYLKEWGLARKYFYYDEFNRLVTKNNIVLTNNTGVPLYAFYDIATIFERYLYGYGYIYYVVDKRQTDHFNMLKEFIKLIGIKIEITHIAYGYITDVNNVIFNSRSSKYSLLEFLNNLCDNLGYSNAEIRFGMLLFEMRHRIDSNYVFVERVFYECVEEAKKILHVLDCIKQQYDKSDNTKYDLSMHETKLLTRMYQLYELTFVMRGQEHLDRISVAMCDLKLLLLEFDVANMSITFVNNFICALPILNIFLL